MSCESFILLSTTPDKSLTIQRANAADIFLILPSSHTLRVQQRLVSPLNKMPDNGTTIAVPDDPTPQEESGLSRNQVILIVICAVVGVVLIAVALVTFCLCKKKKKQRKFEDECESEKHDKLFHDEEMMKKYNDDKKEKIYTGLKTLGVQYSIDTQTSAPNAAVTHHQSSTFLELNEEREGDLLMAPLAAEESVSESLLNDSRESLKKPLNIVIPRDGSVKKKSVRPQSDYQTTETAKYVPKLPPKKKVTNYGC